MFGFSLSEYLRGIFVFFLFGIASCLFYYILLLLLESLKNLFSCFKGISKETRVGLKSIYADILKSRSAFLGIGRHIYDFFAVFFLSAVFSILTFALFDGVIRFIAVVSLLVGWFVSKPIVKKVNLLLGKIICSFLATPFVVLFCIKRHFFAKNNKISHKTEQNVSKL